MLGTVKLHMTGELAVPLNTFLCLLFHASTMYRVKLLHQRGITLLSLYLYLYSILPKNPKNAAIDNVLSLIIKVLEKGESKRSIFHVNPPSAGQSKAVLEAKRVIYQVQIQNQNQNQNQNHKKKR